MPDLNLDDFDLDIQSSVSRSKEPGTSEKPESESKSTIKIPATRDEERVFIQFVVKELEKNWDRASGVLTNLKNSKVFEITGDPSENHNIMGNLQRDFEQEILHGIDTIVAKYKELTTYPKSISSYSMNYNRAMKDKLQTFVTDRAKLDYILSLEMQATVLNQLNKFGKMMSELMFLINQKTASGTLKTLNHHQQKMFDDAKTSSLFCLGEIDQLRRAIEKWQMVKYE